MAWFVLVLSGLMETVWATSLAQTDGFRRPSRPPSSWSRWCCRWPVWRSSASCRSAPLRGVTGIGAVGTAIFGMVALGEPVTVARSSAWG